MSKEPIDYERWCLRIGVLYITGMFIFWCLCIVALLTIIMK